MIVVEAIQPQESGGLVLLKTYSDSGFMIRQNGTEALYSEAYDPQSANRSYIETDIPIMSDDDEEVIDDTADKAEGFDILMGVKE